jgi:hypothetical protein
MKINIDNQEVNLPDFFVVGAPKCGTTSLYDYLKSSDNIFLPKVKEPQYFAYKNFGNYFKSPNSSNKRKKRSFITSFQDYKKLFLEASNNQVIGDFSTHYLRFSDSFIENINDIYGNKSKEIKIIMILRNPVERAYSHFVMRLRDNNEDLSFVDAINPRIIENRLKDGYLPSYDYLRFSSYAEDIQKFKANFPNCRIYNFSDFVNDTKTVLNDLILFLEIKSEYNGILNQNFGKSNVSGIPKRGILNKLLFKLIFRRNIIKNLIPIKFKQKWKGFIKQRFGKKIMDKRKMTQEESEYAHKILVKEISSFEHFSY